MTNDKPKLHPAVLKFFRRAGRKGGLSRSPAKVASSRRNILKVNQKIDQEMADAIVDKWSAGKKTIVELAEEYRVHWRTIYRIVRRGREA